MYKAFSSELLWFPERSLRDDIPLAVKYAYQGISFDIKREFAAFTPVEVSDLLMENKLKPASFALPVEFRKDKETFEDAVKAAKAAMDKVWPK